MKKIMIRLTALLVLLAMCTGTASGCGGQEPVQPPVPQTESPVTPAPATSEPQTPVPETPSPIEREICAVYERPFTLPDDDVTSARVELFETDGILRCRYIYEYPYGRVLSPVFSSEFERDGERFSAVFDGYYERIELSGTADEISFDYYINGDHDPISGVFTAAEAPASRFPDIPQFEADPHSPGEGIEINIARAAREALGLGSEDDLTEELCANVERLELEYAGVTSLQGIEYFTNLECIYVRVGYITDLTPLLSLKKLIDINIQFCPVEEFPDFSPLENLRYLTLMGCMITDVSPAANLKLTLLDLSYNRICSVAPLKDLMPPERLVLNHNYVTDWDSLSDRTALAESLDWDLSHALAVQERAEELIAEIIEPGMTDLQKQLAVCSTVHEIGEVYAENRSMEPDGYEVLINGRGICSDFAQATAILMNMAGVPTLICESRNHAWNIAEIDGEWYEFDCFWDDDLPLEDWSYFNLSYDDMARVDSHTHLNPWVHPLAEHSMMTLEYIYQPENPS